MEMALLAITRVKTLVFEHGKMGPLRSALPHVIAWFSIPVMHTPPLGKARFLSGTVVLSHIRS